MTAMIGDSWSGARETAAPRQRRAHLGPPWDSQAIELAGPHHRSDEPTVAVACAVLCGAMVARGRFGEAWHWLGRAERILQAEAEPGPGMLQNSDADLISKILDLLVQTGRPAAPGSEAAGAGERGGAQATRGGVERPRKPLTEGETRVLRYLPTHLRATEIAAELHLSANTVKTHLRHLYQKLGAHSRREAVERARAFGLLASSSRSGWQHARLERNDWYDSDKR
jgi:DNA-binding CsgD family transcriptional regulator